MKPLALAALAACTLLAPAMWGRTADAQSRPLPQKQLSRGAVVNVVRPSPQPRPLHLLYGTLRSVHGAALVLQTRSGGYRRVDAAPAIAAGTYSAPLFAGKVVVVSGYYDTARVLHAQIVQRLTRLDPSTGPDR